MQINDFTIKIVKLGNNDNTPKPPAGTFRCNSHFYQPGHSIVDMEFISLELQPTLSMSRRKALEAYLTDRGKTLSLDQTVWTEGMNIELFLFILGMGPGAQAPSLCLRQTGTSRA